MTLVPQPMIFFTTAPIVVDADARPSPLRPRAIGSPRSGLPVYTLAPANALGMRASGDETRITPREPPGIFSGKRADGSGARFRMLDRGALGRRRGVTRGA